MKIEQRKVSILALKYMERADKELKVNYAQQALENPLLDKEELLQILSDSLNGTFIDKKSGKEIHLEIETMMAGFRNLFNRFDLENKK